MPAVTPFGQILRRHQLEPARGEASALQINVGYRCNQACRHCHLEGGLQRPEIMDAATIEEMLAYAQRGGFQVADITSSAPELNHNIERLLEDLCELLPRVILRASLTALANPERTTCCAWSKASTPAPWPG